MSIREPNWIALSEIPAPKHEPVVDSERGVVLAPRPVWATHAGHDADGDLVRFAGPSAEVEDASRGNRVVVEVQAELTSFLSPTWVEWSISRAFIRLDGGADGLELPKARELAAEILRLCDEVEGVEQA